MGRKRYSSGSIRSRNSVVSWFWFPPHTSHIWLQICLLAAKFMYCYNSLCLVSLVMGNPRQEATQEEQAANQWPRASVHMLGRGDLYVCCLPGGTNIGRDSKLWQKKVTCEHILGPPALKMLSNINSLRHQKLSSLCAVHNFILVSEGGYKRFVPHAQKDGFGSRTYPPSATYGSKW